MLAAIMVIFKEVNPIHYNVEFVSTLIIVYTCVFGWRTLIPIYVFILAETAFYGFGYWVFMYLYIWSVLALIILPLRKMRSPFFWAVIAGIYGLLFGALCSVPDFISGGVGFAVGKWIDGLPFDFIHCGGNFALTLILYKPLLKLIEYGKKELNI
jgi:energy-coupling factor transport system substrate-specific component